MATTQGCTPQESSRQQLPQQSFSPPSPQQPPANQNPALASPHIAMGNSRQRSAQLYGKYNSRMSRILGKTQIIGGALAFVVNAVGLGLTLGGRYDRRRYHDSDDDGWGDYWYPTTWSYYIGTGLWCAAFTILSGSFALWAAKKRTKCAVITHMVLAIWAALMALTMLGVAVGAVGQDGMRLYDGFQYEWRPNQPKDHYNNDDTHRLSPVPQYRFDHYAERIAQVSMVVSVLFLLVAVSQVIASIWSSTLGCRVVCTDCTTSWDNPEDAAQSVQFLANNSGQPQLLVLDRRGRQIKDAQVIQIMPGSGMMLQGQVVPATSSPLLQEPATQPDPSTTPQPKMDSDHGTFGYGKLTEY